MKCPHCGTGIHFNPEWTELLHYKEQPSDLPQTERSAFAGAEVSWEARYQQCPECKEPIIFLIKGFTEWNRAETNGVDQDQHIEAYMVWPRASSRCCPPEVPIDIREDFEEASEVLEISPKASAALSRRCLQNLLRNYAQTKSKDLAAQIDEIIARNILSSVIAHQLDAVRNIGNFAAHPLKNTSTGEIVPVEPNEAEWNLDVLEELFDHFFVKPAKAKARKDELNKKLAAIGKPLLP